MGQDLKDVAKSVADDEGDKTPPVPAGKGTARDAALTVIVVLLGIAALYFAKPVLVPVAFALLISYALDPVVTTICDWRIPRSLAAVLVLTALVGGTIWLGYGLRNQATELVERLPTIAERVMGSVHDIGKGGGGGPVAKVEQAASTIEKAASEMTRPAPAARGVTKVQIEQPPFRASDFIVNGSKGMIELAAQAVVVFFLALYLLASGDLFKRKMVTLAGPTLSEKKLIVRVLNAVDRQVEAFLLIRLVISVIVAVATWLGLAAIGLGQAGLWGVLAGALNVVPYLGPTVITLGIAVAGFLQFGTVKMAVLAGSISVVVGVLEGYLLTPWLTSRAARMNAVAVFLGLLFWGWVWGLAGLLLAVPLVMVIKSVCDRVEELRPIGELLGE
jgi:predicted PurR-regulated permease PerM